MSKLRERSLGRRGWDIPRGVILREVSKLQKVTVFNNTINSKVKGCQMLQIKGYQLIGCQILQFKVVIVGQHSLGVISLGRTIVVSA